MKKTLIAMITMICCIAVALAIVGCKDDFTMMGEDLSPEPMDKRDSLATSFPKKPFYALLVGNDSRDGTVDEGKGTHGADGRKRSDTMMLLRIDPKKYLITIVSIPRDTETYDNGEKIKLNYIYNRRGIEGSVAKVEEFTGVNIKYYFDVSFSEFVDLVDKLGGVDVNVPAPMVFYNVMTGNDITLDAGDQHLKGDEALVFARVRKIFQEMDSSRQYDDRQIIQSLMQKAIDNPSEMADYTSDFMSIVHTNMKDAELVFYLSEFIANSDKVKFYSGSFPADGGIDAETELWLAWYNPELWKAIMDVVDAGGDPNEVYTPPFG